jgi:hypothetical protein
MSIIYINPYRFAPAYDPDAQDFINRVIAADVAAGNTSGLEVGVQNAYNAFVVGCKADGIWSAIKASCILAGARTLVGALVPLVGTAPTNFFFVAGDYNRKTGLVGNGTTKYLNSNIAPSALPQNSGHACVHVSTAATFGAYLGAFSTTSTGWQVYSGAGFRLNSASSVGTLSQPSAGFIGINRESSTELIARVNGNNTSQASTSTAPSTSNIFIFARNFTNPDYANARLAFYSIGEFLNLALLDARVTTLVNAIAAAIP